MKSCVLIQVFVLVGILNNLIEGSSCGNCSLSQVNFIYGDNIQSVTPRVTAPTVGSDGCLRTTVSCDVREIPNAITYMGFQNGLGGPTTPTDFISANLVCTNGSWVFTQSGYSTAITEVSCMLGGVDQNCGTCKPCDIVFTPKKGAGTIGSYWRNYVADSNGCLSLTAVCPASPSGGPTFMQFNGNIGGPMSPTVGEITANFKCLNGTWQF
ncbi:hypothetical protein FO519_010544, partial [Halicephalobus sp. NKZ332]